MIETVCGDVEGQRAHVAAQLRRSHGSGEHDVGPRLGERGGERDLVGGPAETVGNMAEGAWKRRGRLVGESPVGEPFLDDDAPAPVVGLDQGWRGRRLEEVPGRLHAAERVATVQIDRQRPAYDV